MPSWARNSSSVLPQWGFLLVIASSPACVCAPEARRSGMPLGHLYCMVVSSVLGPLAASQNPTVCLSIDARASAQKRSSLFSGFAQLQRSAFFIGLFLEWPS
jgi:hypothetical protein